MREGRGRKVNAQALLVAGGRTTGPTSSVMTLLPSATSWTTLSPLSRRLWGPASSMVGGRLWLVGGKAGRTYRREVGAPSFMLVNLIFSTLQEDL